MATQECYIKSDRTVSPNSIYTNNSVDIEFDSISMGSVRGTFEYWGDSIYDSPLSTGALVVYKNLSGYLLEHDDDLLDGIMTIAEYHELADLADEVFNNVLVNV